MTAPPADAHRRGPVLITGGSGLIGRALASAYGAAGVAVHTAQRSGGPGAGDHVLDVTDPDAVGALVDGLRPSLILHLAANSDVTACLADPDAAERVIVGGTRNVLRAAASAPSAPAVLVASSVRAYDPRLPGPFTEETALASGPGYGGAKARADAIALAAGAGGQRVAVVRPANVYGPGDPAVQRIVPAIAAAAWTGAPLVLRTDGTPAHDLLFIDDAVAAYLALAECMDADPAAVAGQAFNIGTGVATSVRDLVATAERIAGAPIRVRYGPPVADVAPSRTLDAARIGRLLGWRPAVTLEAGLGRVLAPLPAAV